MNSWEILNGEQIHTRILENEWELLSYDTVFELYVDPIGIGNDEYINIFLNFIPEQMEYNNLSYYLLLNRNLLRPEIGIDLLGEKTQPTVVKIIDIDQSYIFYLVKMLLKNSQLTDDTLSQEFACNIAEQLLLSAEINRRAKEPNPKLNSVSRYNLIALEFVDQVKARFRKHKSVHYYAKKLGVTVKSLSKATQLILNITPKDFIQKILTQEALNLLEHSDKSVKEISYELGIKENNNFSSFFKKMTNFTPLEYRRVYTSKKVNNVRDT